MVRRRRIASKGSLGACLSFTAMLATACAEPPSESFACGAPVQLDLAKSRLAEDPFAAIKFLQATSDCDEKFALMYAAEAEIARNAQRDFYYQGEVYPRGWYDEEPSHITNYVLAHVDRFESAGEAANISANSFWLDQIRNRSHPVFGSAQLNAVREFDYWVLEDGDGSPHTAELRARYRSWLTSWPAHPDVPAVRERISELEEPPN